MNSTTANGSTVTTDPTAAAKYLADRVAEATATSMVRIGDGEGVILARPEPGDPRLGPYIKTHFGDRTSRSQLNQLADRLIRAIGNANLIGLRPDVYAPSFPEHPSELTGREQVTWARKHLPLRREESAQLDAESAHRLILLGRWMSGFQWPREALLTSAWIHFDWLESGFLAELAMRAGRIGLVSGRTQLASGFRAMGVEVDDWPVPLRFLRRDNDWTPHFPARYNELLTALKPAFPGQLFFVGAGICGKAYCDVIAQRGGIALDIGAVCDAWLGLATRPRVARHRWGQESVPEHLLLENQLKQARQLAKYGDSHGS